MQGAGRGGEHHAAHTARLDRAHQVGHRLPDGERGDDDPDREAAVAPEPGGGHLHRRWVHAREEDAGGEAAGERGGVVCRPAERRVGGRPEQRADGEVPPGADDVGEVEDRRPGGPHHEAELHRGGEPPRLARGEVPQGAILSGDRAGGEPERHPQHLGQREEAEHAPPASVAQLGRLHDAVSRPPIPRRRHPARRGPPPAPHRAAGPGRRRRV